MAHDKILILDFGSPSAQLLARCVRAQQVYCELHPADVSADFIRSFGARGVILCSGTDEAEDEALQVAPAVFELGVPLLAIGEGLRALVGHHGGEASFQPGSGQAVVQMRARGHSRLFADIEDRRNATGHGLFDVCADLSSHIAQLPVGFNPIGTGEGEQLLAIANESLQHYGLAFHPELDATPQGNAIIARFVRDICACRGDWTMDAIIADAVARIQAAVGSDEVILGLSGGVDSSVAAALIHRAIGDQLTCVFVDHGLLRLNEGKMVLDMFADRLHACVVHVDASAQFLDALAGVDDPEAKRKIIGREFVEVFQAEAKRRVQAKWLAQGTIYPDVIESGAGRKGKVIKSHHNVGGLPETLGLQLLEPLRELFKDEVRQLGVALGLPHEMVYRHPFPGPGLGVRILGAIRREYADLLRQADAIFIDELRAAGWYDQVSQAFAVFLPVKSVGVSAGARTYDYVVSLRAVQTIDFMTAHWAELPYSLLGKVSQRIIEEVDGISRVVYDISGKPPATIEWE
ncbi:GMP synthase (glutamine-hydrolyzing) [Melaminivora suipulveris]|uniref:GMP synthase [glutamine-hydrolyzing] n=1 Tax=Melaminivora suipulveris TaxID=2109913 RepID=A0A2R3QFW6_9BURK|nr:glutamine-hydrolyzing GMP synthase [Melaminivora suipulveris]AVO50686.1 GMP synthase (glutamine-hydrolyzing) [Melaminivora suipulveris]